MSRGWLQEERPSRGEALAFAVESDGTNVVVEVAGERVTLELPSAGATEGWCRWKGSLRPFVVVRDGAEMHVWVDGATFVFRQVESARGGRRAEEAGGQAGQIVATMPGKVLRVMVAVGDRVEAEQAVVALESMKMEHVLRTPGAGVVKAVRVGPGDRVDRGTLLVEMEAQASTAS